MMGFSEVLSELMKRNDLTAYRLARETGISEMTVGRWKNGKATPSGEHLTVLSQYFGVSTDFLLDLDPNEDALDAICRSAGITKTFLSLAQEAESAGISPSDFRSILQTVVNIKSEYRAGKRGQK